MVDFQNAYRRLTASERVALEKNGNRAEDWDDVWVETGFDSDCVRDCYLGRACVIGRVGMLLNYKIGRFARVSNVDSATFNSESYLGTRVDVMNECGGRSIGLHSSMTTADAYLWAKFRADTVLMESLSEMTRHEGGAQGMIGEGARIVGVRSIEDCYVEQGAIIQDAGPLRRGVIGRDSRVLNTSMAGNFVLGQHCTLSEGARLFHTVLGDNSCIECCEVRNSLVFPGHQQHHNSSFLIASLVGGQSNVAAGATLGSNHNGRVSDCEMSAGRGFWAGLCTSVKFPSKFASYTLLSKADYPHELNIPLPFSLVGNNLSDNVLEIMPAYWWMYNMYALQRCKLKFRSRDSRRLPQQMVEWDPLAPDTVEEIISAREKLAVWLGRENPRKDDVLELEREFIENSKRKVRLLKPKRALQAYSDMIIHYGFCNVFLAMRHPCGYNSLSELSQKREDSRSDRWLNIGGQIVKSSDLEALKEDIKSGELDSWSKVHARYSRLWEKYREDKLSHSLACLKHIRGVEVLAEEDWTELIERERRTLDFIESSMKAQRQKDYASPWRRALYDDEREEMLSVIGKIEDDEYIKDIVSECTQMRSFLDTVKI